MSELPESFNRIEDVKRRLYDRDDSFSKRRREGVLHEVTHKVASSWNTATGALTHKKASSFGKKFFFASIVFCLLAISFALFMFFQGSGTVSSDNIDIKVLGNSFTEGGVELPIQIEILNTNNAKLELADLTIEYPRGASTDPNDMVRLPREKIGTINAGERVVKAEKVILFGDQNSIKNITVRLEYHPEGSNAIFSKEASFPVTISKAPLDVVVDGPTQVTSNQPITFKITASLNTTLPEAGTVLKVEYPTGFRFDSALPKPTVGSNVWSLVGLTPSSPLTILVRGSVVGQDGDEQAFHIYTGTQKDTNQSTIDVVYNSLLHTIAIRKPLLEAHVAINGDESDYYSAHDGDEIRADVVWSNNLPNRIVDAEITLHFSGNAYDKDSIKVTDGFYDSLNNQIVWNRNTNSDLGSVEPGGKGHMNFSFKPKIDASSGNARDPQIVMEISMRGSEAGAGTGIIGSDNVEKKIVKIISDFQIAANSSFASGPIPPQAEQETVYTIDFSLSNSLNTIAGAEARAILPLYVKWGGLNGKSAENVSYNDITREIVWNIGNVKANTGAGSSDREISFNVILKPSTSQVGSVPQLVKDIVLSGQDVFAGTSVKFNRGSLTTKVSNDANFKAGDERVVK